MIAAFASLSGFCVQALAQALQSDRVVDRFSFADGPRRAIPLWGRLQ